MSELTICMPSRRNLQDSRSAIESALAVCEARDAILVIADNSGDAEKKAFWQSKSPYIRYVASDAPTATDNMIFAVKNADTPFIILMGDDDLMVAERDVTPIDLADLPFDYVGVFPASEMFINPQELMPVSAFSLEQDDACERMMRYMTVTVPTKAGFYSIFRREIWLSMLDLFNRFHPNRAAFCDWAISIALFTSGKMASDPSLRYRYNMAKWATNELIEQRRNEMFAEAGLPEKALAYERLFLFLDVFVLVNRVGSPLAIDERQRLGKLAVQVIFSTFIARVANKPEEYQEGIAALAEIALEEEDSFTQFQLGLLMAERVQPGLKDKYVTFIQAAVAGA
jgi:glycosyltransferase involved in cell wall biosynthesis